MRVQIPKCLIRMMRTTKKRHHIHVYVTLTTSNYKNQQPMNNTKHYKVKFHYMYNTLGGKINNRSLNKTPS